MTGSSLRCPDCDGNLVRGKEGIADHTRNTYLRDRVCQKCGAKLVSAEVLFPEDRQAEELRRLSSLRYARRAKPVPTQHT